MPIVSQFYGVIVRMYYDDMKHHNMPHIHIQYNVIKQYIILTENV